RRRAAPDTASARTTHGGLVRLAVGGRRRAAMGERRTPGLAIGAGRGPPAAGARARSRSARGRRRAADAGDDDGADSLSRASGARTPNDSARRAWSGGGGAGDHPQSRRRPRRAAGERARPGAHGDARSPSPPPRRAVSAALRALSGVARHVAPE